MPVNGRRQTYQTVSGFEDSPRPAVLRTPGLRLALKSRELQRELVRKAPGKRLSQNCRARVLLESDDTVVRKEARKMRDPGAPFQTTSLNDAGAALGPMKPC